MKNAARTLDVEVDRAPGDAAEAALHHIGQAWGGLVRQVQRKTGEVSQGWWQLQQQEEVQKISSWVDEQRENTRLWVGDRRDDLEAISPAARLASASAGGCWRLQCSGAGAGAGCSGGACV